MPCCFEPRRVVDINRLTINMAASAASKIKVENPVVDILGDEMTRIIWDVRYVLALRFFLLFWLLVALIPAAEVGAALVRFVSVCNCCFASTGKPGQPIHLLSCSVCGCMI